MSESEWGQKTSLHEKQAISPITSIDLHHYLISLLYFCFISLIVKWRYCIEHALLLLSFYFGCNNQFRTLNVSCLSFCLLKFCALLFYVRNLFGCLVYHLFIHHLFTTIDLFLPLVHLSTLQSSRQSQWCWGHETHPWFGNQSK